MSMTSADRIATVQPAMDAYPSLDAMGALCDRAYDFFLHPRKLVCITRFINESGADQLDIETGIQAGPAAEMSRGGNARHGFCTIHIDETHGVSFSTNYGTSASAARAWDRRGEVGVLATQVRIDAHVGSPSNFDTFEVEYWNDNGVGHIKTFVVQS